MKLRLFNAKRLARELAHQEVAPEAQATYLLASMLMFTALYYSGLVISTSELWSLPSALEAAAVAGVAVIGLTKCFEAAGGSANKSFLVDFTCLYVPVTLTTTLVVWCLYWAIRLAYGQTLVALSEGHFQFARNLALLGTDFFGLLGFMATVGVQVVTYSRMSAHLATVRRTRTDG